MDPSRGRTSGDDHVAEIRSEIEAARARIAETLGALRFKTDVPARLGDSAGHAAATFTTHVLDRITADEDDGEGDDVAIESTELAHERLELE
jgi:hypothetical protein